MSYLRISLFALVLGLLALPAYGADYDDEQQAQIDMFVSMGNGVVPEWNEDGTLARLYSKRTATIPKSMEDDEGEEFALEEASDFARGAMAQFFEEQVTFSKARGNETTISKKDGNESSESIRSSAQIFLSESKSILSGIGVVYQGIVDNKAHVVLVWSPKSLRAAEQASTSIQGSMQKREAQKTGNAGKSSSSASGSAAGNGKNGSKEHKTRHSLSPKNAF